MRGIHRWLVNSPHKGPVTQKMFPFDDVIVCTDVQQTSVKFHRNRLQWNFIKNNFSQEIYFDILTAKWWPFWSGLNLLKPSTLSTELQSFEIKLTHFDISNSLLICDVSPNAIGAWKYGYHEQKYSSIHTPYSINHLNHTVRRSHFSP